MLSENIVFSILRLENIKQFFFIVKRIFFVIYSR